MKTETQVVAELERANAKLAEIEKETREAAHKQESLLEYERRWKETHGFIEGLWWVLGSGNSSGTMLSKDLTEEARSHLNLFAEIKKDHIEIEVKDGTNSYEVWYGKENVQPTGFPLNRHELEAGYTKVALVKAGSMEQVYDVMQHENWTPKGEAFNLVQRIRLDHVSMQEGDLIREIEGDHWWVVAKKGFREFK